MNMIKGSLLEKKCEEYVKKFEIWLPRKLASKIERKKCERNI